MMTFWNFWILVFFAIFSAVMIKVIFMFFVDRHTEDFDQVIGEFDGIVERDGAVPPFAWKCYAFSLGAAIIYLLLLPGIFGDKWNGLLNWSSVKSVNADSFNHIKPVIANAKNGRNSYDLTALSNLNEVVSVGRNVFMNNCVACHRENAQGQQGFPNLADNTWNFGNTDEDIIRSISHGINSTMPGFDDILTEREVRDIANYLISQDKSRVLHTRQLHINKGRAVYQENCAMCHGLNAEGGVFPGAFDLSDSVWLYGGSKNQIMHSIKYGQKGAMPSYKDRLTQEELISVAAYVKGLSKKNQAANMNEAERAKIEKGEYLARAGDCIACHTEPEGGETFAGGLAFHTPFGSMYSTNITPHYDTGIGKYSYEDFYKVMKKGKGLHGYLYPAMPYASYKYTTDEDIEAIWAFLKTVQPVDRQNSTNHMMFPSNIRLGLLGWNTLFLGDDNLGLNAKKSDAWNRGKYLVMGLGHCAECHTPRTLAQAMDFDRAFQGNIIEGWQAPNITATQLYRQNWTIDEMTTFLKYGYSSQGSSFATMKEVIVNSTGYLSLDDNKAIATYLLEGDESLNNVLDTSVEQFKIPELTDEMMNDAYTKPGYELYAQTCGTCHGAKGEGREGIAPHLYGNTMFSLNDPYNLIAIIIRGLSPMYATKETGYMPMSNFGSIYTDEEIATLVSFTREYGGQSPVTAKEVKVVREKLERSGFAGPIHAIDLSSSIMRPKQ